MKPGKVYLKIFLSFLAVLVVTEGLIFALFMAYVGRSMKERVEQYTGAKVILVKEMMEQIIDEEARLRPDDPLARNGSLDRFVRHFGEILGASVWLSSSDGKILVQSFEGPIPAGLQREKRGRVRKEFGGMQIHRLSHDLSEFYATIPVRMNSAEPAKLHLLFEKIGPLHPEHGFGWGLVLIGLVIAVLVIPVSRLITKPLNALMGSALRIAEGDLSHRASIRSRDEIGEVGVAFNRMADRLEGMIRGGKILTANVSHQLRSPLARIRVAGELLQEKLDRGDARGTEHHLRDIQEDVEEMDRMIGQLLTLSKLDIHEAELRPTELDAPAMVRQLLEQLRPMMDQKSIRVHTAIEFAGNFHADREATTTIFNNLLENACKYTPEHGAMKVLLRSEETALRFAVTNETATILSGEQMERIFDPFYRIEGSNQKGSGLGLAITRKLVERQGGSIQISQSAEGLCFSLFLPSMQ
jgi:signal transduction histidine kinase